MVPHCALSKNPPLLHGLPGPMCPGPVSHSFAPSLLCYPQPSLFLFLQHAKLFLTSGILHTLFPLPGTSSSSLFSWLFLVSSEFQLDCCLQEGFPDHPIVSRISLTSSLNLFFASFMEVITAFLYLLVGMDGSHLFSP